MIFFSIGLPSRFAEWCDELVLHLVERQFGSAEAVALNGLEELAAAVIRARASNLVACCRQPVPRLQTEILQAERPFLVALGDPRAALQNLVTRSGFAIADAVRAVASSCAAMKTITKATNALVLTPADAQYLPETVTAVLRHYGIPCDSRELSLICEQLRQTDVELEATDIRAFEQHLSEQDHAVISGAVAPYVSYFTGGNLERLVWEPDLFYMSEEPAGPTLAPVTRPVELTGRVRFLVYGPFINLPPGTWSADVVLGFSAEAAGMAFNVEVFAGGQLAQTRFEVAGEQVLEARLYFTIGEAIDQPIQLRISNERAAFDGRLALGYVTITPQSSIPRETRERLENALRQ